MAKVRFERLDCAACYFAGWAYDVAPAHYASLGVLWRSGAYGSKYQALAGSIDYDFAEGDLFYRRGSREFLQVAAVLAGDIEVHAGVVGSPETRAAFTTTPGDFALWLMLGWQPASAKPTPRGLSRAGLLAWSLPQ